MTVNNTLKRTLCEHQFIYFWTDVVVLFDAIL